MAVNDIAVQEFVNAIKEPPQDTNNTYNAIVSRIDDEGVVWVYLQGSEIETPTASTSSEVEAGDSVTVQWRNNKLYIGGNYSNPSAGTTTVMPSVNFVSELLSKNISADSVSAATGYIGELTAEKITAGDIQASTGYIKDLTADSVTTQDIKSATGYIADLEAENITAQDITADHATVGSLDANYAHITDGVIDNAKIGYADVNNLSANYAQINIANVNNAWIENGAIKKAEVFDENVFDLSGNRATLSRIDASKINVANLRADNLVVRRINGQPVVGGYTLIDSNSPQYETKNPQALGWYEFVNAEWVLSTDTTVDMTKAYYQEGNEVSLYDQAYIDALEDDLQQQIDGAVETYTGTVVPTLVNKPYTDWYDTSVTPIHDERAKHIGNIYYVVNSAASENGYCYRFAYDNTSHAYSWVLIKDSDVTKALSDISELKTFESNTTSWMDETDEGLETIRTNHTALSGVVDKTVKESVQLWFTKANTTAPNKPTAEVTSTSTSGNAWRKVVPAWNASYPNYYYCWQYKFVDGTFGWSDVVRDIAMGETQGTARDAKNTADAALPASTFTSFESTTFKNVKDTVDEQTTKFTNMTTRLGLNSDGTGANTDIVAKESALEQTVDGISTRVGKTETKLAGMYATSSTAAGTAAKVATIVPTLSGYELAKGAMVTVKFTTANTAASPTLNLNGTGAKAIKTYSGGNLTADEYKWKAGSTFTFTYNGTNWLMQDSSASVRMNSAETGITQNAEQIALRAKSSDVYTKGQVYTKTEADSAITQKANKISLSVAQTEISKIEVGGRNILGYTADFSNWRLDGTYTTVSNGELSFNVSGLTSNAFHRVFGWLLPSASELAGKTIVVSAEVYSDDWSTVESDRGDWHRSICIQTQYTNVAKWDKTSSYAGLRYRHGNFGDTSLWDVMPTTMTNGKWHRIVSKPMLLPDDLNNDVASGTGSEITIQPMLVRNGQVKFRHLKVEIGNKATDWSPAPEDLEAYTDSQVSAAKAEIKVTTDGISTEVEKKTDKSTIISTIRQSAETVKIKASQVEINGTATFNAIKSKTDAAYDAKGAASAAESNAKDYADGAVADKADKSNAVARTQRIYYRKTSSGAPSANKTWLATSGTGYGNWSLKVPQMTSGTTKYPYLYTAVQTQTVAQMAAGNACSCSAVLLDDTTTVIDGGHITTGTIDSNRLNADTIKVNAANIQGSLTIGQLPSTVAETSDIPTKVSELSNDSGYQTASDVSGAIVSTTTLYYASNSTTAPNKPTAHVTTNSASTRGAWNIALPAYNASYPHLYVCTETKTKGGAYAWTSVEQTTYASAISAIKTTADGAAPKSSAIAEEQRIYYRSNSSTKPNGNGLPTTWVTETGDKYNTNATTSTGWSKKVTPIANGTGSSVTKYLYLWTCIQKKTVDGTVTYGDILLDDSTTVIDGGKIVTGSVSANAVSASSGTFDTANIPNLNANKITAGDISADRMKVNSIAAINSLTTGKIDAARINVGQITVGSLSDGSSYSTTSQMKTAIGDAVDGIEVGGRNLLLDSEAMSSWYTASGVSISGGVATLVGSSSNWDSNFSTKKYDASLYDGQTTYTWSFEYKSSMACIIFPVIAGTAQSIDSSSWTRTKYIGWTPGFTLPSSGGVWTKYTLDPRTIALSDLTSGSGDVVNGYLQFYCRTDNANLQVRHFKLEKGNKATDWTPAPEDVVNENILSGSQKMSGWCTSSHSSVSTSDEFGIVTLTGTTADWSAVLMSAPTIRASILDGTPLWLSFEYKASVASNIWVLLSATSTAVEGQPTPRTKYSNNLGGTYPATTTWQRSVVKMPTSVSELINGSGAVNSLYAQFYNRTNDSTFQIRKVKLERGAYASEWTPSPEDFKTYITRIDDNGIRIHPSSTQNNSVVINASGMEVFNGGTTSEYSVAKYGDTARIGKGSGSHLTLSPDSMSMSDGTKDVFNLLQKTMYIYWNRNYKGRQFANSTDRYVDSWDTSTTISTWDSITVNYKRNNTSRTKKITSISNGVLANDEIYVHFNYSGTIITLTYGRGSSAASSDIIKLGSAVVYYVTDKKLSQLHTGTYPNTTVSGALRIGNGTSDSNRINLMLVDWSGTGKFKGDILAFCGADSSGGMSLTKAEENIDAFKYEDANGHVYIDAYRVGRIVSLLCIVSKTTSIAPGADLYRLDLTNAHLPKPLGTNTSGTGISGKNMIIGNIYYNKTVTPNKYEFVCRNGGSTAVSTGGVGFTITYICQMDEVSGEIKYMDD